jgi:hypothetical protein
MDERVMARAMKFKPAGDQVSVEWFANCGEVDHPLIHNMTLTASDARRMRDWLNANVRGESE